MKKKMSLFSWFLTMLYISAFTFGGGYAMLSMMKREFADKRGWIQEGEILDLASLAQSAPGAVAVNGAVVFGYRLAGISGVLTGVLATILPPFFVLSQASGAYEAICSQQAAVWVLQGMAAGTAAVVLSVFWDMISSLANGREWRQLKAAAAALAAILIFKCSAAFVMSVCVLVGIVQALRSGKEKRG